MNDDFNDLEKELKLLRPRSPSPRLEARVARELTARQVGQPSPWIFLLLRWVLPAAGAAAALLAFVFLRPAAPEASTVPGAAKAAALASANDPKSQAKAEPVFEPVSAERTLVDWSSSDPLKLSDGTLVRSVRQVSYQTLVWRDPKSNAELRWTLPREDVCVVPVVAY